MIKQPKATQGKGLSGSKFQVAVHHQGEVKAGTQLATSHPQARAERNECILACLLESQHPAGFLQAYTIRSPKLGNGAAQNGLGLPTSVNNPDSLPETCSDLEPQLQPD